MAINEKTLTKGQLRKLNALRKSLGTKIADRAFTHWLKAQPAKVETAKSDPVAEKLVAAMAICSPATQSTASLSLITVAPGWTVSLSTVHVGVLLIPCMSRVLCFTAMHLLPKMGKYGDEMFPCIVIVSLEV